ncbi:MAG: MBL fold metallo-hydrolase [Gammaproteobacteria bacterium]|jgi:phosphoribosyl 1,2-cyclic phosphodiesterase|nr:MBL fold metallo-hydrolase [Gammaproteobacteria bacterium]MBT3489501.1 MBL fold metallo-hydrolase [Gammaproteobacteria bacterium]MBT3719759.1 MBL fold metallo-hydrolase [Gammaproteobacteria bacterium]MBT3844260.1 MBL fold metallo-hydrolase [Gammaproteobacteria bacterium]MBT3894062.1 MBL fold metallo-hydrolase [Gammaproteobacteria bacterium]
MRFASIGSGSKGNGTLVESGETTLLVDCGFSMKQARLRLDKLGRSLEDLDAILVTHEHSDHLSGVRRIAEKYDIPVWMSAGTAREAERRSGLFSTIRIICGHQRFSIGEIEVNPYHVPHDAVEPLQFTFSSGQHRVGLLTDVGEVTPHIEAQLNGCNALLLECNHDLELLGRGPYPLSLKQRVSGRLGHLNNQQAAALLEQIDTSQLQHLVVMHLSEQNNSREKALLAVCEALDCSQEWVGVADQQDGFTWREVA